HAALAHPVRTTEVQFQPVGAGVFGAAHDVVPGLACGLHHERCDHGVVRILLFDGGDFAQVGFDRAVADEFDIVQPHHALAVPIDRGVARAHVDDGLADRL